MSAWPANTLVASASTAAPGAGAAVASITAPDPGVYKVSLTIILTGTAETQLTNLRLRENAATVATALPSIPAASVGGAICLTFDQVEVNNGGGNLDVIAIAAATGGSVYTVVLTATRVG